MELLTGNTGKLYRKYLVTSMLAALATTIYSFVDTIAIGQSEGPIGTAAMAVITPVYGLTAFMATLCGIGGSVLMGSAKGAGKEEKGNACFTAALLLMGGIIAVCWIGLALFSKQVFTFFGADEVIMPKVMEYGKWIVRFFPVFIAPAFFGAFLRNDHAPGLAMLAVVCGGCTNLFGDWFFVFPLGMGMEGAAVATVCGTSLQVIIMCSHFFSKRCTLKIVKPIHVFKGMKKVIIDGFGSGILDFGMVVITILMNKQIMRYGGTTELAIYGVLVTISALCQALFCGIGQALQPLVSANYGAGNQKRILSFWRMSLFTTGTLSIIFCGIGLIFPTQIIRLFIKATPEVLTAAPAICRVFFLTFLSLGFSVLSIYYLQSIRREKSAMLYAAMRSIIVSGGLIALLPILFDIQGIWAALPVSETLVAAIALLYVRHLNRQPPQNRIPAAHHSGTPKQEITKRFSFLPFTVL